VGGGGEINPHWCPLSQTENAEVSREREEVSAVKREKGKTVAKGGEPLCPKSKMLGYRMKKDEEGGSKRRRSERESKAERQKVKGGTSKKRVRDDGSFGEPRC